MRIRLIWLSVVLSGCGVGDLFVGKDCTSSEDQTYDVSDPDPPMALRIDSCRVDADACPALCNYLLQQHSLSAQTPKCEVTFEGAVTHVETSSDVFNGGPNCPVFEDDAPDTGGGL